MRKRTWQKFAAVTASIALVFTTPGASSAMDISDAAQDDSLSGDIFSSGAEETADTSEQEMQTDSSETEVVEFVSDFSSGETVMDTQNADAAALTNDMEADTSALSVDVTLADADTPEKMAKAQGEYQWVHITSNASGTQGQAKVRIQLTDSADNGPDYILHTSLFSQWQEAVPGTKPSPGTVALPPTILETALNGTDALNVSQIREYQKDESGEYVKDENGNLILNASYLEYELPAGSSADFYAAFGYETEEETYSYAANVTAQALQEVEGTWQSVLVEDEDNQQTVAWEPPAAAPEVTPTPEGTEVPEVTPTPEAGEAPEVTPTPEAGEAPEVTPTPEITETPEVTPTPEAGEAPEVTPTPEITETPEVTPTPEVTEMPEVTPTPEITEMPEVTPTPEVTEMPEVTPAPEAEPTETPEPSKAPEETVVPAQVRVTMTKELAENTADVIEEVPAEEEYTDVEAEENAEIPPVEAEEGSVEEAEPQAVSGETYAVHINAEDVAEASVKDSTVTLYLKDLETGAPVNGITAAMGATKEEALAVQAADTMTLTGAVTTAAGSEDLIVSRVRETTADENGEETVTSDYLQFTLPAGGCADFYLGLTYQTEAESYREQLMLEAKAYQYLPKTAAPEPTETPAAEEELSDKTSANEPDPAWELLSPSLPGAMDMDTAAETVAAAEPAAAALLVADPAAPDNKEEEVQVSVLEEGCVGVMLAWSAARAVTFKAGDYLYLDISGFTSWANDSAYFALKYNNYTQKTYMELVKENLYRVEIPLYIINAQESNIQFCRCGKANGVETEWNYSITTQLDRASEANSNTFGISDWNNTGSWQSGVWNVSNFANKTMYFRNMTSNSISALTATFSAANGTTLNTVNMQTVSGSQNLYQVTIPDGADYNQVVFKNEDIVLATETFLGAGAEYNPNSTNTFYYGATEKPDGIMLHTWGTNPEMQSIANKKLYFSKNDFPVNKKTTIQIGTNAPVQLEADSTDTDTFSYTIPEESTATQQTIITISVDEILYHFLWKDLNKNLVSLISEIADADSVFVHQRKVYFDAALSKTYIPEVNGGVNSIPGKDADSKVYYYAWNSKDPTMYISSEMSKENEVTENGHTWKDVWYAELSTEYDKIIFADVQLVNADDWKAPRYGRRTGILEIPGEATYQNPCFYANPGDPTVYSNTYRDGHWNEWHTVNDTAVSKNTVDIPTTTGQTKEKGAYYVSTTFYDYYSDYEIAGNNRDGNFTYNVPNTSDAYTNRRYVPTRLFDQALSDYYQTNNVEHPLYFGHFQWDKSSLENSRFPALNPALKLYGYDANDSNMKSKFYYDNNSMWRQGIQEGGVAYDGTSAATAMQGLASDLLTSGKLSLSGGKTAAFMDEEFLNGNNTYNTVIGSVYHDVDFPFKKIPQKVQTGDYADQASVDYWTFDSAVADQSLQMTQDSSTGGYYLNRVGTSGAVHGFTDNAPTGNSNFFPFNNTDQSGNVDKLNYAFGCKIEIPFKLTQNGTVKAKNQNGADVDVPIEFNFSGDDDVWVYIDDHLVLDIGGGHGRVEGTINFQDLYAQVSRVKNYENTKDSFDVKKFFGTNNNGWFKPEDRTKEHTLTMFYMERGLWESNMKITFNFPDENKLWVEKEVQTPVVDPAFANAITKLKEESFGFDIQNLATHEDEKAADSNAVVKADYNPAFADNTISKIGWRVRQLQTGTDGSRSYVQWKADGYKSVNEGQDKTDERLIAVSPVGGRAYNASEVSDYLSFDIYNCYNGGNKENGSSPFIALVDSSNHVIGAWAEDVSYKSAPNRSGNNQWMNIQVDLAALKAKSVYGSTEFDFADITQIRFGYWNCSELRVSNIEFHKAAVVTELTGFTTLQKDIPSYGSVTSGKLEPATGAQYSLKTSGTMTTTKEVVDNGTLHLKSGQTATFADQFRRGSYVYIAEKGVNTDVFDTSWSIYDDNEPVNEFSNIETLVVDDNRTENNPATTIQEMPTEALLFRSYSDPNNTEKLLNVGVKFVNTLKTGNLKVTKQAAPGYTFAPGTKFKFKVSFTDIAGMGLERAAPIVMEFELGIGEAKEIPNIPAGTSYIIEEVLTEEQKATGVSIAGVTKDDTGNDNAEVTNESTVTGVIKADETGSYDAFTFFNANHPTVDIRGEKIWKDLDGSIHQGALPANITVKLQRSADNGKTFTDVIGTDENVLTVTTTADTNWAYGFYKQDKYVSDEVEPRVEYVYRVVETKIGKEDVSNTLFVFSGGTEEENYNITNTYHPKTNLTVTKVNAANTDEKLKDVTFKLERLTSGDSYELVSNLTTSDAGIVSWTDLDDGTYRLTETKAADGYSLLKAPVIIVINRADVSTVDGKDVSVITDNTITIQITNRKKFELPATGSWSRLILGFSGAMLTGLATIMYLLQKRRKEGKAS